MNLFHIFVLCMIGFGASNPSQQWCPNKSFYEFIPVTMAIVNPTSKSTFEAGCFTQNTASLEVQGEYVILKIDAQKPVDLLCSDAYVISSDQELQLVEIFVHGNHTYKFKSSLQEARVFFLPCGLLGTATSAIKTIELFDSSDLNKVNQEFFKEKMSWDMKNFSTIQTIDPSLIKSGDQIHILSMDGLDPMIAWGTGGRTGHTAIAIWERNPDQLYVMESTDKNPFGKVYWPPPYGVIRTPYLQWIQQAEKAGYNAVLLPLKPELRNAFNEEAAWAFFGQVVGLPYGYQNFLFSVLDTFGPMRNLPKPIDAPVFELFMNQFDDLVREINKLTHNATKPFFDKISVQVMIIEGLNQRLGSNCQDMPCVNKVLKAKNMSLAEATSLPEQDEWLYGGNRSMVCSVFVSEVSLHALGSKLPNFQATEQTPKDVYQMAMFDPQYFTTANCPIGLITTPSGNYCQLVGKYKLELPGYNTIPPYNNMNNKCPAQWPDYFRCPQDNPQCC